MSKKNMSRLLVLFTIALSNSSYANIGNKFFVSVENNFPNSKIIVKADTHEDWEMRCVLPPEPSEITVPYGETSIPIINTTYIVYDYCKPNTLKHIIYFFDIEDQALRTIAKGSFRCEQRGESQFLGCHYQDGNAKVIDEISDYHAKVSISPL